MCHVVLDQYQSRLPHLKTKARQSHQFVAFNVNRQQIKTNWRVVGTQNLVQCLALHGHELVALSGFSFEMWQPRLVLIEDHVTHLNKHQLMRKNNYQLLMRTGLNSWYVRADLSYTFSIAAMFEYVRKYYLGLPLRKFRYSKNSA